jgi:DnaJ-class molecular chaperone
MSHFDYIAAHARHKAQREADMRAIINRTALDLLAESASARVNPIRKCPDCGGRGYTVMYGTGPLGTDQEAPCDTCTPWLGDD